MSETEVRKDAIDELVSALSKPIFLYRMSGPGNPRANSLTRDNAKVEIDRIVTEYVKGKEVPEDAERDGRRGRARGRKLRKGRSA